MWRASPNPIIGIYPLIINLYENISTQAFVTILIKAPSFYHIALHFTAFYESSESERRHASKMCTATVYFC